MSYPSRGSPDQYDIDHGNEEAGGGDSIAGEIICFVVIFVIIGLIIYSIYAPR